ncbi:MAG: hypothetical protein K8W52_23740, partial [Deltaproteobacteria bacterium]|nr:hypothetical protein [Deltaproteobacteria bacterium]
YDDAGHPRAGTCKAVAATGQACSSALPLTLCATGSDCSSDTDTCVPPVTTPLAVGAACIDASYNLLGTCTASWCDIFGSKQCEPLRVNGATCGGGDECASGRCDTTCVVNDVCTDHPPTPDAGVADAAVPDARTPDAMPPDAMPPDAGTPYAVPADGERCTSAFDLLASSSASPLPGYTNRIARGFGATNDYNPLSSGALPPACSVVYDAKGKELVYAVTLVPGDKLKLRAELADGKQAGIYLLDTCPGGSWPDFDGTGACGSNEYNAGFCGPVGCDPAALTITYPLTIGGNPTTTQTFWVVVDQVGGDTSTGFVLDWSLIHL